MMPSFIPSCREVSSRLAFGEFKEASWKTKTLVRVHLFMCRDCRRFLRQMRIISEGLRETFKENLTTDRLNAIQSKILSRLQK